MEAIMANISSAVSLPVLTTVFAFQSYDDAGYQQALNDDKSASLARAIMERNPGFPDESLPDSVIDGLKTGYARRFHESHKTHSGITKYSVVNGQYIRTDELAKDAKPFETIEVSLHVALAYTTHDYGRLHETRDATYKKIIGEYREKFSTYASQKLTRLAGEAKRIKSEDSGEKRKRTSNLAFNDWWTKQWDGAEKRLGNAIKTGSAQTADKKRFAEAKAAFLKVWTAQ
jgi:hypothetical protein